MTFLVNKIKINYSLDIDQDHRLKFEDFSLLESDESDDEELRKRSYHAQKHDTGSSNLVESERIPIPTRNHHPSLPKLARNKIKKSTLSAEYVFSSDNHSLSPTTPPRHRLLEDRGWIRHEKIEKPVHSKRGVGSLRDYLGVYQEQDISPLEAAVGSQKNYHRECVCDQSLFLTAQLIHQPIIPCHSETIDGQISAESTIQTLNAKTFNIKDKISIYQKKSKTEYTIPQFNQKKFERCDFYEVKNTFISNEFDISSSQKEELLRINGENKMLEISSPRSKIIATDCLRVSIDHDVFKQKLSLNFDHDIEDIKIQENIVSGIKNSWQETKTIKSQTFIPGQFSDEDLKRISSYILIAKQLNGLSSIRCKMKFKALIETLNSQNPDLNLDVEEGYVFSALFQKKMQEIGFMTGNLQSKKTLVGMRLKRVPEMAIGILIDSSSNRESASLDHENDESKKALKDEREFSYESIKKIIKQQFPDSGAMRI